MLRQLLGLALLAVALGLFALAALVVYRGHVGDPLPSLPPEVESGLRTVEEGLRQANLHGVEASHLLGGVALVVILLAWAFLRSRPRAAAAAAPAAGAEGRGGRRGLPAARSGGAGPWLLALAVVGACAGVIAALYYGPDTFRLTDTLVIRRGPRDRFLRNLTWGGGIIAGLHVLYFLVLAVPRLFARATRRAAPGPGRRGG